MSGHSPLELGKAFLAENASKPGVITTASGLQYLVLEEGPEGGTRPTLKDTVVVHYRGTSLQGVEFDSSYRRDEPAEFPLKRVIKGWKEGLQLMKEGDKFRFFVPTKLAYGARGSGLEIAPHESLIFEVHLLKVWAD
ncbi:FKBP-type peptidyl-prolyl cis-trans isomerase FklB [Prosthecobacter debontii]|uniref:Peptidyl-prolyl cis-trans isomerase n=1 Tax=Prosthecobacter debontii TaxID=48467 RepID=A0A1T4YZG0_9BACT|nr:FKBP-type peptidyl-prolyl cis-trans isomerase [Prosthecobacter debontii]SKB07164.1 FKBP-type peptidyl-prolyl cis-trans isomerase FklB [Prosthecobacter debontii]